MAYPNAITPATDTLEDGGAAITAARAGKVSGVDAFYDFGADIEWAGFWIADVSAITTGVGRSYQIKVELCAASDFGSGVISTNTYTLAASPGTDGQIAVAFSNKIVATKYRYGRMYVTPIGGGASITLTSWLIHANALASLSTVDLVNMMAVVSERFNQAASLYRAWSGGVVDGGPDSDGKYPLSDAAGNTYLVECPAKIVDLLSGGLTTAAVEALDAFTVTDDADLTPTFMGVVGPSGGRALKRFSPYLFNARRTQDLEPLTTLISEELIPSYNASTGLERSIAVSEIARQTLGLLPAIQFGVLADCVTTRHNLSMTNGDNVVECDDPIFMPDDVGKNIQVGGAKGSGLALQSTITGYTSHTQVTIADNATADCTGQDGNWGTLNTANLQNALNACFSVVRGPYNYGGVLLLPEGQTLTGCVYYHPRCGVVGHGSRHSTLVRWNDTILSSAGEFPQYDGDTTQRPYTLYQDGSKYYPIFPNAYRAPYYTGDFIPDVAPTICNRIGTDKDGVTWDLNGTVGAPSIYGRKVDSDFNVFNNFGLDGSRYCATQLLAGLEFRGGLFDEFGAAPYFQIDPYLRMRELDVFRHGWIAMTTFGQCSGLIVGMNIQDNGACGWHQRAFDSNISGGYVIGNAGPGIVSEGSNTNWTTMKISFNGTGGFSYLWGDYQAISNLVAGASGDNWNNLRVQESKGPNVYVQGKANDFTGCHFDDTGCVGPVHGYGTPTWITPAIYVGWGGDDLRLNDAGIGALVHPGDNYASHAVYWQKDPGDGDMGLRTTGRAYTKGSLTWYQPGSLSGDYTPNEWGADDGVAPTGTSLTLNGVDITTL